METTESLSTHDYDPGNRQKLDQMISDFRNNAETVQHPAAKGQLTSTLTESYEELESQQYRIGFLESKLGELKELSSALSTAHGEVDEEALPASIKARQLPRIVNSDDRDLSGDHQKYAAPDAKVNYDKPGFFSKIINSILNLGDSKDGAVKDSEDPMMSKYYDLIQQSLDD